MNTWNYLTVIFTHIHLKIAVFQHYYSNHFHLSLMHRHHCYYLLSFHSVIGSLIESLKELSFNREDLNSNSHRSGILNFFRFFPLVPQVRWLFLDFKDYSILNNLQLYQIWSAYQYPTKQEANWWVCGPSCCRSEGLGWLGIPLQDLIYHQIKAIWKCQDH